ncbi:MAG: sulfite exporter TauE/SafE family protein, partial [bacterium]
MYFPVADITLSPWIPLVVAFGISFFTSMAGISGAFLILPFQMSVLGFSTPAVSSTNQLYNIIAIPSGVYRYLKEGRMVWPLTWIVIIGTLPGVMLGAVLRIRYLPDPTNFKMFAGLVLLYIGGKLLKDLLTKRNNKKPSAEQDFQKFIQRKKGPLASHDASGLDKQPVVTVKTFTLSRIRYEFIDQVFDISVPGVMILSLVVGIIGGVYGIGGGSIIAPFFVAIYGLPIYTIAGAALMGTFVTSVA